MNSPIEIISHFVQTSGFAAEFLDASLKSFVVLAVAGGLCLCWRRALAATRHWIWFLAVACLPFLPLLSSLLPSWQRPLWSVSTGIGSGNQISLAVELAPVKSSDIPAREPLAAPTGVSGAGKRSNAGQLSARVSANGLILAVMAWGVGVVLMLVWAAAGQFQLGKLSRRMQRVEESEWTSLLEESCARLRVRRRVILCRSRENIMPLTWGWRRPVVLLPAEADAWPVERRRVVLLHELAHVKRWDCLTQLIARIVRALFWFNPLVWLAERKMCVERELACDDLVLSGGCKASDYAGHLVDIARSFRHVPGTAAIAMARLPQLEGRVTAIVDASRRRSLSRPLLFGLCVGVIGLVAAIAAQKPEAGTKPWWDGRLRAFFEQKAKQAHELADQEKKELAPEVWPFFDAGVKGDWTTTTNLWSAMRKRAYQYEGTARDERMATVVWAPILELDLAWEQFASGEEKYVLAYGNDIINSIPPGSIYFGGTDPGRGLPTAMCKSHVDADPFFTITQNALADGKYEQYLRMMYGSKIYIPTTNDVQKAFNDYVADAGRRLKENKLKPGEGVRTDENGEIQVSGQIAVMSINALIVRTIIEKNPDRGFYIEESFALDWMYPYLLPNGLIMKINRQPLTELPDAVVRRDHDCWTKYVQPMIGGWLNEDTPVKAVTAFAERVYLNHDLNGFKGDPAYVQNVEWAPKAFSKLRVSIGGIYAWRADHAASATDKARMVREADFAFRQAFALCPYSPEAVFRYVQLLKSEHRNADALLIAETAARMPSLRAEDRAQLQDLAKTLK